MGEVIIYVGAIQFAAKVKGHTALVEEEIALASVSWDCAIGNFINDLLGRFYRDASVSVLIS